MILFLRTDKKNPKRQQFRRTRSAVETSSSGAKDKVNSVLLSPYSRDEDSELKSRSHRLSSSCHSRMRTTNKVQNSSRDSKVSKKQQLHAPLDEENNGKIESTIITCDEYARSARNSDASDSDSDDHARSRTPLLARHSSNNSEPKSKNSRKEDDTETSSMKKFALASRSLDEEKCNRCCESSAQCRDNVDGAANSGSIKEISVEVDKSLCPHAIDDENILPESGVVNERRFVLVPQDDSMTGWNSAGGPFASQWLFQAVNVAVKAITLLNSGAANSTNNNPG